MPDNFNPIQYTSRDFTSIMNDINSDPELADKPAWWKRIWAGVGDVLSMCLNAVANQAYLRTAFTRKAVIDLCNLIDYQLASQTTASGLLSFHLNPTTITFPKTFQTEELVALSQAITNNRWEARTSKTLSALFTEVGSHSSGVWTVAHIYSTGDKIRLTTSGTIPTGLTVDTDYYVIKVSDTQIRLASTIQLAFQGTYIPSTSGTANHTIKLYTFTHTVYQQQLIEDINVGTSDGTQWQKFDLPDLNILADTLVIDINGTIWTKVDTFVYSLPTDTHYRLYFREDNSAYIMFGDGVTYGAIPGNFAILADYAVGGGRNSNVTTLNYVSTYSGANSNITGCCNAVAYSGGAYPESISTAKIIAPQLVMTRDTFVTEQDGEALTLNYGGVTLCKVNRNYYGILTAQVVIVPAGGGSSSGAFKTDLTAYLVSKTLLNSILVAVVDATPVSVAVSMAVKVKTAYVFANLSGYVSTALKMATNSVNSEIIAMYRDYGIATATVLINSMFSTSYTTADYSVLEQLILGLKENDIGQDIQESDLISLVVSNIPGIDYVTISAPTFPVSITDQQISNNGSMTVTEST